MRCFIVSNTGMDSSMEVVKMAVHIDSNGATWYCYLLVDI